MDASPPENNAALRHEIYALGAETALATLTRSRPNAAVAGIADGVECLRQHRATQIGLRIPRRLGFDAVPMQSRECRPPVRAVLPECRVASVWFV
jgi:hypothetical protein